MDRVNLQRIGTVLLFVAALLVGVAIVMDSDAGRVLNGAGGLLWFASTATLLIAAAKTRPPVWLWILLAALTITVAFIVRPSAAVPTLAGFIPAGFVIAALAPRGKILWATLVPACYLPAHIGTAVVRSAVREMLGNDAPLRTDPPPTAAIVPLLMVICALVGGYAAIRTFAPERENVDIDFEYGSDYPLDIPYRDDR